MKYILLFFLLALLIVSTRQMVEPFVMRDFNMRDINESDLLLSDSFPVHVKMGNSRWWKYPIVKVGSYAQTTNNFRSRSVDNGRCTPGDFCDAFYDDVSH